MKDTDQKLC